MPLEVFGRFDKARKSGRRTADVLLDAVAAAYGADGGLTALVMARRPEIEQEGLFPGRVVESARAAATSVSAGDSVPVSVRMPAAHLDAIDEQTEIVDLVRVRVRPTEPPISRSELLVAALDFHLPARNRS